MDQCEFFIFENPLILEFKNDRNDVVYKFVEHRKNKIRRYIGEVNARFPVPVQCTVEGSKSKSCYS